jgi:hypothetical protein
MHGGVFVLLEEGKQLVKLKPQEHKELVNSKVVYFIPVQVENVEEALEPLFLVFNTV